MGSKATLLLKMSLTKNLPYRLIKTQYSANYSPDKLQSDLAQELIRNEDEWGKIKITPRGMVKYQIQSIYDESHIDGTQLHYSAFQNNVQHYYIFPLPGQPYKVGWAKKE